MAENRRYFGLECAPPPMPLESTMADKAPLWRELVQRHQLAEPDYRGGRLAFRRLRLFLGTDDMFADGSKARRFGFHQFVETEAMFFAVRGVPPPPHHSLSVGHGLPQHRLRGMASERQHDLPMCSLDHQRMQGGGLLKREGFKICGFSTPRSSSGKPSRSSAAICALSATLRGAKRRPGMGQAFQQQRHQIELFYHAVLRADLHDAAFHRRSLIVLAT